MAMKMRRPTSMGIRSACTMFALKPCRSAKSAEQRAHTCGWPRVWYSCLSSGTIILGPCSQTSESLSSSTGKPLPKCKPPSATSSVPVAYCGLCYVSTPEPAALIKHSAGSWGSVLLVQIVPPVPLKPQGKPATYPLLLLAEVASAKCAPPSWRGHVCWWRALDQPWLWK